MDAKEFVACWKCEKEMLLKQFQDPESGSAVAEAITALNLSQEQTCLMNQILDSALTDAFYTLLTGLDGGASLGGVQQTYKIYDEQDELLSDCGEIEAAAWDAFHGDREDTDEI
ncbi:hypothetical protein Mal35_23040 [Gimesia maris]|uniref:hypothetical protein n=1 Tax=Gimesia maris TaxID=122 RepID=UPI001188A37B|nr:hypothetical protein [Gimesia maris]QDT78853.1 hypothetical protein Mal35_23040 [Gimesia maris]